MNEPLLGSPEDGSGQPPGGSSDSGPPGTAVPDSVPSFNLVEEELREGGGDDDLEETGRDEFLRLRYLAHLGHIPLVVQGYLPNLMPLFRGGGNWSVGNTRASVAGSNWGGVGADALTETAPRSPQAGPQGGGGGAFSPVCASGTVTPFPLPEGPSLPRLAGGEGREGGDFEVSVLRAHSDTDLQGSPSLVQPGPGGGSGPSSPPLRGAAARSGGHRTPHASTLARRGSSPLLNNSEPLGDRDRVVDRFIPPKTPLFQRGVRRFTAEGDIFGGTSVGQSSPSGHLVPSAHDSFVGGRQGGADSAAGGRGGGALTPYGGGAEGENPFVHVSTTSCVQAEGEGEGVGGQTRGQTRRKSMFGAGSMRSSVFNLTAATLGAGALTIPFAMRQMGLLVGLVVLAVAALISTVSIALIIHTMNFTELKTFEELAVKAGGRPLGGLVVFCIILFCFGTAVGYLITVGEMAQAILAAAFGQGGHHSLHIPLPAWASAFEPFEKELLLTVVTVAVLLPLSITEKVGELRFTCFLGVAAIAFLAFVVVVEYFVLRLPHSAIAEHTGRRRMSFADGLFPLQLSGVVRGISLVTFAYTCQTNVPSIYCELEKRNARRMLKVASRACLLCFVTYVVMGICGFLTFGDETEANILSNYSRVLAESPLLMIAFGGMAFSVTFAYPMCIFPVRFASEMIIAMWRPQAPPSRSLSVTIAVVTVLFSLLCAICVPSISIVFELVGASAGATVSFVVPGYLFVKLLPGPYKHPRKLKAVALICFGAVAGILGTGVAVYDIVKHAKEKNH